MESHQKLYHTYVSDFNDKSTGGCSAARSEVGHHLIALIRGRDIHVVASVGAADNRRALAAWSCDGEGVGLAVPEMVGRPGRPRCCHSDRGRSHRVAQHKCLKVKSQLADIRGTLSKM